MTKRTWSFRFLTTLLFFGLAACGGGGGGGGGSSGIPTASNPPITPPPTQAAAISVDGAGAMTSPTNQSIAVNAFQASGGAVSDGSRASGLLGIQAESSGTQAGRETFGAIVRRHAEKLKDHERSATGAVEVETQACAGGGTATFVFDDANLSATEVFVNCSEGGAVVHGTVSSSTISVIESLGATVGSPYTATVNAAFTMDLSVATSPGSSVVTQGSFNFSARFSGTMVAAANGGVAPGVPNRLELSMSGASLLSSNGTLRERLSDFAIFFDDNNTLARTTVSGNYIYASTIINGSVRVIVLQPIVDPDGVSRPNAGAVDITSPASPGKIVLTVATSPIAGVRVDVYADANSGVVTNTASLTWDQVDAL